MRFIINFFNKNSQLIFFSLIFYGLSITIFLEEINQILSNLDLRIFEIYRVLIVLFSLVFFFNMNKKINLNIILILLISFIFIFNTLFGEDLKFDTTIVEFYVTLKRGIESFLLNDEFKFMIINLFNVILPLTVLGFCKNLNFEIEKFKVSSFILCNIFLYLIFFLMIYKLIFLKYGYVFLDYTPVLNENNDISYFLDQNGKRKLNIETKFSFVNVHSLLLILDMYFILLIDRLFCKKERLNYKSITDVFLIFFCFILSDTSLHLLICTISFFIYLLYFKKKIKYFLFFLFSIFLIIFLLFQNIFHSSSLHGFFDLNSNEMFTPLDFTKPGSFGFSIYVRIMHIKFFLLHSTNLNLLIGNKIFAQNIYTYPHNFIVDIFVCSGLIGISLFLFVFIRLLFFLKNKINENNFFFLNILIQSFIFSNLSGFFFTNIIFNIALAACFCFFKVNDSAISRNS